MTSANPIDYPALYRAAGQLSAQSQSIYLTLLKIEYGFLVIAAILSLKTDGDSIFYVWCAIVLIALIARLLYRTWQKPEQAWYKGRALAESIKTTTWRYCMRAAPFECEMDEKITLAEFRNYLKNILESNRHIGEKIPPDAAAEDQITDSMQKTRGLNLKERKDFYLNHRIKEQRAWYASKAGANKKLSRNWTIACATVYGLAIILVLLRISKPQWPIWPIDPLIVVASSIIGWMQIKKFNELASAYTLTAHEIGILQTRITEADNEKEFSEFVNEAELAFSREHTQWVARQNL